MSSAIPYDNFILLHRQFRSELDGNTFKLFSYVADKCMEFGGKVVLRARDFITDLGMSESTIRRKMDGLVADGVVVEDRSRAPYEYSVPALAAPAQAEPAPAPESDGEPFKLTPPPSIPAEPTTARALVSDVDSDSDSDQQAREARNPEPARPSPYHEQAERLAIEDNLCAFHVEQARPPDLIHQLRNAARAVGQSGFEAGVALAAVSRRVARLTIHKWAYVVKAVREELKKRAWAAREAAREVRAERAAAKIPAANIAQTSFNYEAPERRPARVATDRGPITNEEWEEAVRAQPVADQARARRMLRLGTAPAA